MEDQQREFYANGAKSPKLLTTGDKVLTKEQRGQLEENFKEIAGPVKTPLDTGSQFSGTRHRRKSPGCRDNGIT
jgi:hypothetical protein